MKINYPSISTEDFLSLLYDLISVLHLQPTLTHLEKRVLSEFLQLPSTYKYYTFSLPAKRKVISLLLQKSSIKLNRARLNTIIYSLLSKKFLYRDEDDVIFMQPYIVNAYNTFSTKKAFSIEIFLNENNSTSNREDSATA